MGKLPLTVRQKRVAVRYWVHQECISDIGQRFAMHPQNVNQMIGRIQKRLAEAGLQVLPRHRYSNRPSPMAQLSCVGPV